MLGAVVDLLACPACGADLALHGRVLGCDRGHAFDTAADGSATLSAPVGRRPPDGDTPAMVAARLAVLDAGHYAPLVAALVAACADGVALADLGSGPGFYAGALLDAGAVPRAVAVDVSAAAVRRAARRHPALGAVRADVRTRLPIRDAAVDRVLVCFAPRNPTQWVRILAPGGRLVVAVPGDDHLGELRATGALLGQQPDKVPHLLAALPGELEPSGATRVRWSMDLDDALAADLAGMGPAAHHDLARSGPPASVSADVHVLTFARLP